MSTTIVQRERPEEWIYDEKKSPKQFMLTETASIVINRYAKQLDISRSEVIERAIRCGGLECAKNFDPQTGQCQSETK